MDLGAALLQSQFHKALPNIDVLQIVRQFGVEAVVPPMRLAQSRALGRPALDALDSGLKLLDLREASLLPGEHTVEGRYYASGRWRQASGRVAAGLSLRMLDADSHSDVTCRPTWAGLLARPYPTRSAADDAFALDWVRRHGAEWPYTGGRGGVHPSLERLLDQCSDYHGLWAVVNDYSFPETTDEESDEESAAESSGEL